MKKVVVLSCMLVMLFVCMNGALATEGVSGEIGEIENSGKTSLVTLHIQNETDQVYSYGWVNTCFLHIQTDEQEYRVGLGGPGQQILPGRNEYKVQMPLITGKITGASITGICLLDSSGLPAMKGMEKIEFDLVLSVDKVKDMNNQIKEQNAPAISAHGNDMESNSFANPNVIATQNNFNKEMEASNRTGMMFGSFMFALVGLIYLGCFVFIYFECKQKNLPRKFLVLGFLHFVGAAIILFVPEREKENKNEFKQ